MKSTMRLMAMKFDGFGSFLRLAPMLLPLLLGDVALRCAGAEQALLPASAATDTNQAAGDIAEHAWKELQKALRPPPRPESWRTNAPSSDEIGEFNRRNGELAGQVADKARDFYLRFPNHPKAEEARRRELEMRRTAVQLGNVKQVARLNELEDARAKDAGTEPEERFLLRWRSVQREALGRGPEGSPAFFDALQKGLFALRREFPERLEVLNLMLQMLQIRSEAGEADQARPLAQALLDAPIPENAKEAARRMIKRFDLLGRPIQIRFTATDGREVDLEKLRGKVVLIDFWASWCPACIAEIPQVKATYEKLHPKGLEIIGINGDDDKEPMQSVLDTARIPWPQCFDGYGAPDGFAARFGVSALPTLWLVDKQGVLRDLNARSHLEEKVEKLLSEEPASK